MESLFACVLCAILGLALGRWTAERKVQIVARYVIRDARGECVECDQEQWNAIVAGVRRA